MASVRAHGLKRVLRRSVRRHWRGTINVAIKRAVGARLDRWVARSASSHSGRAVTAHGVPCESFDLTVANPSRVLLYLQLGGFAAHLPAAYRAFSRRLACTLDATCIRDSLRQMRKAQAHTTAAGTAAGSARRRPTMKIRRTVQWAGRPATRARVIAKA